MRVSSPRYFLIIKNIPLAWQYGDNKVSLLFFHLFFLIEIQLIYNPLSVSGMQRSDLGIHTNTNIFSLDSFTLQVITRYWVQLPVFYSSLCLLFYIQYCAYFNPNLIIYPSPAPFPFSSQKLVSTSVTPCLVFMIHSCCIGFVAAHGALGCIVRASLGTAHSLLFLQHVGLVALQHVGS